MKTKIAILLSAVIGIGVTSGVVLKNDNGPLVGQSSNLWKFTNSLLQPVVSSWNVYAPADFRFDGDLLPDGTDCSAGQILKKTGADDWDCASDNSGGGGGGTTWELQDGSTDLGNISSLSFEANSFIGSVNSNLGTIKLDWTNGPASRSTNNTWAGLNIFSGGVSISSSFELTGVASGNWAGTFDGYQGSEFGALAENETVAGNWDFTASPLADNEVADSLTLSGGAIGSNTISGLLTGSATISADFEIRNTASASFFSGSAFSGIDCNDAGDQLLWSGGLFTCETLGDDDIPDNITITNLSGTNTGDVTLAGQNYLSLSGQQITAGKINLADHTIGTLNIASTSLAFSVTGLTYSAPNVTLTAGYNIPLTASTSNWESFYDTPSGRITAGDHISWSGNTLNVDDDFLLHAGDTATGLIVFSAGASGSNSEWTGYASASKYFGSAFSGLSGTNGCAGAEDTLNYNSTTGVFSCGSDSSGGGGGTQIEVQEGSSDIGSFSSLSFDAGMFAVSDTTGEATVKLDWATGPASRAASQTITGAWTFTAASNQFTNTLEIKTASVSTLSLGTPLSDANVADNLTINGGTVTWTDLTSYPTGCTNQFVRTVGDTLTCATVDISADTTFAVAATGLELDGSDDLVFSTGYSLPLTASQSNWETFRDTPSTRITAGNNLTWAGNQIDVDDSFLLINGDTATGLIVFSAGASVTTNFEVSGTASVSALTVNGNSQSGTNTGNVTLAGTPNYLTLSGQEITLTKLDISDDTNATGGTGIAITTNDFSFDCSEVEGTGINCSGEAITLDATGDWTGTLDTKEADDFLWLTGGTLTGNLIGTGASFSVGEFTSYASASSFRGNAFSTVGDCNDSGEALGWDSGVFSCVVVSGEGSTFVLDVAEGSTYHQTSSISFDAGQFDVAYTASISTITLDWGAGGPASLSEAETITGNWVNTANPWADNEVADTLTIDSNGSVDSTALTDGGTIDFDWVDDEVADALTVNGGTIGSNTLSSGATFTGSASISSNFEVVGYASVSKRFGSGLSDCDAATSKLLWSDTGLFSCGTDDDIPDAADYTNLTGGTGIGHAVTGTLTLDATEIEAVTWGAGGNASNLWTFNLSAGDPTLNWTGSGATLSLNFEALGYASASKYFGSAFNIAGNECSGDGDTLAWENGVFTCGDDDSSAGSGVASNSLDFDEFVDSMTLDASLVVSSGSGPFNTTWHGDFFLKDNASVSGNFEVAGKAGINAGGTINTQFDVGGTASITQIILGNGSASDPSLTFVGETNTGLRFNAAAPGITFVSQGITAGTLNAGIWTFIESVRLQDGLFAAAGNVSEPGYTFNGDNTQGMYRIAEDVLGFSTDQTERLRLSVSGASLSTNFEVTGTASISGNAFFYGAIDAGGAVSFELPNGSAPTVDAEGEIAVDTSGFGQLVYYASGSAHTLTDEKKMAFSIGSSSFGGFSSRSLQYLFRGITVKRIQCKVSSATSVQINLSANGTTDMDTLTCATTNTFDDGSISNATVTKGSDLVLERRTISSTPDYLQITVTYVETRE